MAMQTIKKTVILAVGALGFAFLLVNMTGAPRAAPLRPVAGQVRR